MARNPAAFGLYPSSSALHFGAEALRAAKFRHTDISVMYSDGIRALQLRDADPFADDGVAEDGPVSRAGLLTSLSGLGAVLLEDGPYMAGGPILSTLVSQGDSLLNSLRGLGLPEEEIASFEDRLRQGGLLLSVQCDDEGWAVRARAILVETGAERVAASV